MTKLKTTIIIATCHDCKLPHDTTVNWHVTVYKFLQKKLKIPRLDTCPVWTRC